MNQRIITYLKQKVSSEQKILPVHKFKKIGHRGAAGYCPENTFSSYDKAIDMGADYLEIDIQLAANGELVVIHDPTVDRTTNSKGKVSQYTSEELANLDAGSWFSNKFAGEKIPLFTEVLDKYINKVGLLIEIKKPSHYPGIEKKVANELTKRGLHLIGKDRIIVQSFDRDSMKRFHEILPSVPVGVLVKYHPKGLPSRDLKEISAYAKFLNPKITLINRRLIKRANRFGLKVFTWTVRTPKEASKVKQLPLDGIITDFLDYL